MKIFNAIYDRVAEKAGKLSPAKFLLILIVVQILAHLPIIPLPPMGQHTWRQVAGLSQARNFYEEDNNFFMPRMDIRVDQEDQGHIYKELPLTYWLIGQTYFLTGFNHANGRVVQLIVGLFLIVGAYRFIRVLGFSETYARWYAFFISCSPYFFYYSISVIPDFPALTLFIWGLVFLIPALKEEKWGGKYLLGAVLVLLAVLTKPSWLFFGLPLAYLFVRQFMESKKATVIVMGAITAVFILSVFGAQYLHQKELWEAAPFVRANETQLSYKAFPTDLQEIKKIMYTAWTLWFPQLYVNTVAFPLFLVGAWLGVRRKKYFGFSGGFWSAWTISFFIYFFLFFVSFGDDGGYYFTPVLPLAALITTYGTMNAFQSGRWKPIVMLLIFLVPFVMVGRVGHRWVSSRQVPEELINQAEVIQSYIPKNDRVIVMGDRSPIIFLYYLNRKGIRESPSISREKVITLMEKGFKWIFAPVKAEKMVQLKGILTETGKVGEFYILKLNPATGN